MAPLLTNDARACQPMRREHDFTISRITQRKWMNWCAALLVTAAESKRRQKASGFKENINKSMVCTSNLHNLLMRSVTRRTREFSPLVHPSRENSFRCLFSLFISITFYFFYYFIIFIFIFSSLFFPVVCCLNASMFMMYVRYSRCI